MSYPWCGTGQLRCYRLQEKDVYKRQVGFWPESGVAHVSFDFGKVVEFKEIRLGNYAGEAGIENLKNIKIEIQKEDGSWVTILNENGMVTEPVGYREFIFNSDTAFRAKGMKLTLAAGTGYQFYNELQVLAEKGSDVADAGLAEVVGGDVKMCIRDRLRRATA